MKVLIVENNLLNRCLLRDLLQLAQHEVLEADGVESAWATLCREAVALVVMDIQIPGGGGEHLLGRLKADARFTNLPVMAVTALAMRGDRERLIAAGFDEYLAKPIDTRGFAQTVARLLRGAS